MPAFLTAYSLTLETRVLAHLSDLAASPERTVIAEGPTPFAPAATYVAGLSPKLTATTKDLSPALAVLGSTGKVLTAAATAVWSAAKDVGRDSTGVTAAMAIGAVAIPKSLSSSQGDDATLSLEVFGLSPDGATSPLAMGSAALSSLTVGTLYTLGKLTLNGTVQPTVHHVELDFGIATTSRKGAGDLIPRYLEVTSIAPKLTASVADGAAFSSLLGPGTLGVRGTVSLELWPRIAGGGVDSTHPITLAFTGHIDAQALPASGGVSVSVAGEWDGTNSPVAISGAA